MTENNYQRQLKVFIITMFCILFGVLVISFLLYQEVRQQKNDLNSNYLALQDTLRTYKGKSVIKSFTFDNTKDFLDIKSNDSMIIQLQDAVESSREELKRLGGFVASIKNSTYVEGFVPTEVVVPPGVDTAKDSKVVYPTYKSKSRDAWHSLDVVSTKDTTHFKLRTVNKYNVTLGSEKIKGGLFPKYQTSAFVENLSPYDTVRGVRSVVIDKTKKSSLSLGGSVGFGAQYGLINKQIDVGPQAGVSLNFKF